MDANEVCFVSIANKTATARKRSLESKNASTDAGGTGSIGIVTQALQYSRDNFLSRPMRELRRAALPSEASKIWVGRAAADSWLRTGIKTLEVTLARCIYWSPCAKAGSACPILCPGTHRGRRPPGPRGYGLRLRRRLRRLARPSQPRPRRRSLPRAIRPHFQNPHLGGWTGPANLPIGPPTEVPAPPERSPLYRRFGFFPGPVSSARGRVLHQPCAWRQPAFSAVASVSP